MVPQAVIGWLKALMAESLLGRKEERVDVGVGTGATWAKREIEANKRGRALCQMLLLLAS